MEQLISDGVRGDPWQEEERMQLCYWAPKSPFLGGGGSNFMTKSRIAF